MGLFDFFIKKELEEIKNLKFIVSNLSGENRAISEKYAPIKDINGEINNLNKDKQDLISEISRLKRKYNLLKKIVSKKENSIIELDEIILLQDFGLYTPTYDFVYSEQYKLELEHIRDKQKRMILDKKAAICDTRWYVDGSIRKGESMTDKNIKQMLRCFNIECEILIDKVKFNNIGAYTTKIRKSYETLNKINLSGKISISWDYLQLKVDELNLAYEYALKKQEEKDEQRRIRESLREEAKLAKELEDARRDLEKEKEHYKNALSKVLYQIQNDKIQDKESLLDKQKIITTRLVELEDAIRDIDYREANKKAGYVYVISNIGSFGEGVYKIGMTRRLDPMDRVNELGDASVPFRFDVHAIIFSDDAPRLENALHKAFENKRVNMMNNRREFFKATLDEIECIVKQNYDKTVDFNKIHIAEQYRKSMRVMDNLGSPQLTLN